MHEQVSFLKEMIISESQARNAGSIALSSLGMYMEQNAHKNMCMYPHTVHDPNFIV